MAEPSAQDPAAESGKRFAIRKIYIKDVSFETPNSPQILTAEKWAPDVEISLGNRAITLGDNLHEVTLTVTVTAKLEDKTAYLVEVQQAGLFQATGYEPGELHELLGSYCPGLLFPFIREMVANLVVKGGFPQLLLAPVNFDALYAQHLQGLQQRDNQAQAEH